MSSSKTEEKVMSGRELYSTISEQTGVPSAQVKEIFTVMSEIMQKQLNQGPGAFVIPSGDGGGIAKVTSVRLEAVPEGTVDKPNPFKPGEMYRTKAKPARNVLKIRPLKRLKDMA